MSHISRFEDELRVARELDGRALLGARDMIDADDLDGTYGGPTGGGAGKTARRRVSLWDFYGGACRTPNARLAQRQSFARRISFIPDLQGDLEEEKHKTEIEHICGVTWKVYAVSPLFDLKYEDSFFERWSQALQSDFSNTRDLRDAEENPLSHVVVEVEVVPGLRGVQHDANAIRIQVLGTHRKICVLTCFLLAVDCQEKLRLEEEVAGDVTFLPIMLCHGPESLSAVVRKNIERCFDSVVSPASFSSVDIRWMSAIWLGLEDDGDTSDDSRVTFVFRLPDEISLAPSLSKFTLSLKKKQIQDLWKSVHDSSEHCATKAEVELFHKVLGDHVSSALGVHLDALHLTEADLPICSFHQAGKIRLKSKSHAKTILRFLTEICQVDLSSVTPRLSAFDGE